MKDAILQHFADNWVPFFEAYLGELKPAGKQYRALCPLHDDHHPSLDVDPTRGLWHCKACDIGGDAFKLVEKMFNLDFPAALKNIGMKFGINGNGHKPKASMPGKLVKRYTYRDANGSDLFFKNRYEPKGFSICRPDGQGGILSGMGGVPPVLYRLPEVIAADEVWVVEGEKDADALAELEFAATTNFDGAGKWSESYNEALRGKQVILVPDHDEAGGKHVEKVAAALHGVAASIKILELPNPAGKKGYDVSDFLAEQTDKNEAAKCLSIFAEGAQAYQPTSPEAEKPRFEFIHIADVLANLRPTEWRIQDVLTDYALYYNFGDPGSFKTFLELDRLLCIASGIDYHGHKVKQGTVFYICGEGYQGIGRRVAAWCLAQNIKAADIPFFISRKPTQLMDMSHLNDVRQQVDLMAKMFGPPAVVQMDTLARNLGDGDENSTADMTAAISNLDRAFGADFCRGLTHHTGHGHKDRARGAMALHGAADAAFLISVTPTDQIAVKCKKMKDARAPQPMLFNRREIPLQIGNVEDRSFVLDLAAEGEEAMTAVKPEIELRGNLPEALEVLRRLSAKYPVLGAGVPHVSSHEWMTTCRKSGIYKRSDNFYRAVAKLYLLNLVVYDDVTKTVYMPELMKNNDL